MKKSTLIAIILGTFGVGTVVGFKSCQLLIKQLLSDKDYLEKKIYPIIEERYSESTIKKICDLLEEEAAR